MGCYKGSLLMCRDRDLISPVRFAFRSDFGRRCYTSSFKLNRKNMTYVPSLFVVLIATLWNTPIYAEHIFRYLDKDGGGIIYTNMPLQACQKKMKGIEVINLLSPSLHDASLEYSPHGEFDCGQFMAEHESFFECETEDQCTKAFALAQIFVSDFADSKIRIATDSIVETYSPTRMGTVGLKVSKIPGKGHSAKIVLKVACKADNKQEEQLCQLIQTRHFKEFPRFMTKSME